MNTLLTGQGMWSLLDFTANHKSTNIKPKAMNFLQAGVFVILLCSVINICNADALGIDGNSNIGIGAMVPTARLHVGGGELLISRDAGAASDVVIVQNDGPARIAFDNTDSANPGI